MKTGKIIWKNIKLLLRSRTSTLVLILGPLIIIILVGISFSTSSFNLNIGTFSEKYSDLSNDLIEKLNQDNFAVTKYTSEELCIESVKEGKTHACIVFPPDMVIENEQRDIINFHVDQSKINLVYLVMSTLTSSFGEKSSEISKELTNDILTTLTDAKTKLKESESVLTEIQEKNNEIAQDSESSITSLNSIDLDPETLDVTTELANINTALNELLEESVDLIDDALDTVEDLEDYGGLDANQSSYVNSIEDDLEDLNSTIKTKQNASAQELSEFMEEVTDAFEDMAEKLGDAETVNSDILDKLTLVKNNAQELNDKSESINTKIKTLISNIESIQITDTENIVTPIQTKINPIVESESNLGFLFPSLIVMLIMFIGLLLPSTLILMEKNSRAYFRTFTTPTKSTLFVLGTYLTSISLIFSQVIIILIVSQFYFKINFLNSFFLVFLALTVIMSFFVLFGMLIGYFFNSEEMAMLASASIGTLFLLTSGIIFPLESMPAYISGKAKFNPVVLGSEVFKKSLLFNSSFSSIKGPLGILLLFSVLIVIVIILMKKAENIQVIMKKPTKLKVRKDKVMKKFAFGERNAKTLPEFVVSIQNLSENAFQDMLKESVFSEWLTLIYKNPYLGKKVKEAKTKQELIKILVEELKKESEKKANKEIKK
ncbi:ABC transporter permease [Candidatus Woesearchaeota archaeon]|nr:ABC transporter permease [Candidatus Woesearchaeota archaeon]